MKGSGLLMEYIWTDGMTDSPDTNSLLSASSQLNLMEVDAVRDMFVLHSS